MVRQITRAHSRVDDANKVLESHGRTMVNHSKSIETQGKEIVAHRKSISDTIDLTAGHDIRIDTLEKMVRDLLAARNQPWWRKVLALFTRQHQV